MKKISVGIISLMIAKSAMANGVCDIALSNNAINKTNFEITSTLAFQKKEDLCRAEYDSKEEFNSSARNSGFNLGYKGLEIGHSGGKRSGSGRLSFESEEFCKANRQDLNTFYTAVFESSIADVALAAWRDCIAKTERNILFLEYNESTDATGATGYLRRQMTRGDQTLIITDMKVQPKSVNASCFINGEEIKRGKVDVKLNSTDEGFTCDKPVDKNVRIGFDTNVGSPVFMELSSQKEVERIEIKNLEKRLLFAENKILSLSDSYNRIGKSISVNGSVKGDSLAPFKVRHTLHNTLFISSPKNSALKILEKGTYMASVRVRVCTNGANDYISSQLQLNSEQIAYATNRAEECGSAVSTTTFIAEKGDKISGICTINQKGIEGDCLYSLIRLGQ